jgi:hypothetical protein
VHQALKRVTLFALTIYVLLGTTPVNARQYPHFTVFVYDDAQISSDVLAPAEQRATLIFVRAGLDLNWVNCPGVNTDHTLSSCDWTGGPDHLVQHIITHVASSTSDTAFGVAFIGPDGTGKYCDVFWKRVEELHTSDDVDLAALLGSVMAHEIGHLLLGSHAHAISGIMRGHWESSQLHQIAMGTLLFLPWQEQRMRLRVAEWEARLVSNRDGLAQ